MVIILANYSLCFYDYHPPPVMEEKKKNADAWQMLHTNLI